MGGKKTVEDGRRFEKGRRDKLNAAFMELGKLLPDHDPSITLSKVEILRRAAQYIKYLQEQNDEIMKLGEDVALKNETEKLKKRIANLLLKTKELVDALRSAGVPIPANKKRKRKQNTITQNQSPPSQNEISDKQKEEVKDSMEEATTIKKVKCGCVKLAPQHSTPEKRPLKESNPVVTTLSSLAAAVSAPSVSSTPSVPGPPWTNHTKLLTVTPTPMINASVMTTRVQTVATVKQILPSTTTMTTTQAPLASAVVSHNLPKETASILSNSRSNCDNSNSKSLTVIRNGVSSIPIAPPALQTIPVISGNLLTANIIKEVTPTVLAKKNVNIIKTTTSNSLPTQSIVNTPQIITISQSNIIGTPVVGSRIQTVPVIEKNILSNLGPSAIILADGRIVNVPPIVPQILVKPQPTVILMPTAKKKEKVIVPFVPKKRDVTKTTFANKAPIPAIPTFRLESCPKVRLKKKPKNVVKKTEKATDKEKDGQTEQTKKKRKLDDTINSSLSMDKDSNRPRTVNDELHSETSKEPQNISEGGNGVEATDKHDGNNEPCNSNDITEDPRKGDVSNSLEKEISPVISARTDENEVSTVITNSVAENSSYISKLSDVNIELPVPLSNFDNLSGSSHISKSSSSGDTDMNAVLTEQDINKNNCSDLLSENNIRVSDDMSQGITNQKPSTASSTPTSVTDSSHESSGIAADGLNKDALETGNCILKESDNSKISQENQSQKEKEPGSISESLQQTSISSIYNNIPNMTYQSVSNSSDTSQACSDAMQESLFTDSLEKIRKETESHTSSFFSSHPNLYKNVETNVNQDDTTGQFQQGERDTNNIIISEHRVDSLPVSNSFNSKQIATNTFTKNPVMTSTSKSKPVEKSVSSINESSKVLDHSSAGNGRIIPKQSLGQNSLPDLGANNLLDNTSIFPQVSGITQSLNDQQKNYSQANSFSQNSCVSSATSITVTSTSTSVNILNNEKSVVMNTGTSFNEMSSIPSSSRSVMSQSISSFSSSSYVQENFLYPQNNAPLVYTNSTSQSVDSFPNHSSYGVSGSLIGSQSSIAYTSNGNGSFALTPNDKFLNNSSLPTMSCVDQVGNNNSIYTGYCSANFYPSSSITYSQNNYTFNSNNKLPNTVLENTPKKAVPYGSFTEQLSSGTSDKAFYSQNKTPQWDKHNCNKTFYNSSTEESHSKDKNTFQFCKMPASEKPNETQFHSQIMYLNFQNEPLAPHNSGLFQNFPTTSSVLPSSSGFNNICTTVASRATVPSKPQENLLNFNSSLMDRNLLDKSFNSQLVADKTASVTDIEKDGMRNAPFYANTSQAPDLLLYRENHSQTQNTSLLTNISASKPKKTSENNSLPLNNFTGERIGCGIDNQKSLNSTASSNNNNNIQPNASRPAYNNKQMNAASYTDTNVNKGSSKSNNNTIEGRRNISDPHNTYVEKDNTEKNRNSEATKSSNVAKTNTMYSVHTLEKETSAVQTNNNTASGSSKSIRPEAERGTQEVNSYTNYTTKANGKNIQSGSGDANKSNENSHSQYKNFAVNQTQTSNEKHLQENHKSLSSSTHKSVSTEITDELQFPFNSNHATHSKSYQNLLQSQNNSFLANPSRNSGSLLRNEPFPGFENLPFDSVHNQFSDNISINSRNTSISSHNPNHSLPPLPITSVTEQISSTSNTTNNTVSLTVTSNTLAQKDSFTTKHCPPRSDSTVFKGDLNTDFLKSRDLERNSFIPIYDDVRLTSDFSSDIFSSLQVPTGGQHSESISPTAAFLLAFPLVSTSRNLENLPDSENQDNQTSTPTTILQIGNIEPPSTEMFHPIDFQKNNKTNDQYEMGGDFIQVNEIHNNEKESTNYNNKRCEKRKDVVPDFSKDQRTVEPKQKSKSTTGATNSYTQSYGGYSQFACNDYQQFCDKEGSQWQQEFPSSSKEPKKTCEKKKYCQNYQECYNYKERKRKQQNRISVSWMTTSESREHTNYQPKEGETANNYTGQANQPIFSSIPLDFPTDSFSDFCSSKKTNNYSWSPNKTLLPTLDNHLMIPSTLPTLVGDLALGTSTPSESYKTFETPKAQPTQGQIVKKPSEKEENNKKQNNFPKSQGNFFSVSQLVGRRRKTNDGNYKKQEKTSKTRNNFNCSRTKDDQCLYYGERNNFVPHQNQCSNEKRHASYKGGSYSAESLIGAQQNDIDFSTNFNYQQNANYFQADFSHNIDSSQQYGYFQQTHFPSFPHEEYQDFGFGSNQRNLDHNRQKVPGRKEDTYQGTNLLQPNLYPPYSKSIQYNLPSSQLSTNTTTTLTNFNLSTIFPEMNDQRVATSGQTQQQMNPSFSSSQAYRSHLPQ